MVRIAEERFAEEGVAGDEGAAAPWPGMVRLPAAVVKVAACALWPEHESYAAACWIDREAGRGEEAMAPELAQLVLGVGRGALVAGAGAERTRSWLAQPALGGAAASGRLELQLGADGAASAAGVTSARRMVPLEEPRRPWRQLARPCVPRSGRGEAWPAVCERPGRGEEPVLLDRGEVVAQVYEDAGWTLVASDGDDHALCWVPSEALVEWVDEWVRAHADADADSDSDSDSDSDPDSDSDADSDPDSDPDPDSDSDPDPDPDPEGRAALAPRPLPRQRRPAGEAAPAARKLRREVSDAPFLDAALALAEAALARLTVREARGQTAHAPLPTELPGRAELWPQLCAELLEAWADAGLGDDERLAALSATDVILLAISVAPSLDRTTARRYRAAGGAGSPREPLVVGLLLDLAGGSAAVRVRMARRLARDLPLRVGGVLLAGGAPIPSVNEELAVAPWFLAACYGE